MHSTLIMITTLAAVIAAIVGIKLLDLPGLVSAILVAPLMILLIYVLARQSTKNMKQSAATDGNPS